MPFGVWSSRSLLLLQWKAAVPATCIKKKKKQYQSIVSGTANPRGLPEPLANDGL